MPDEAVIREYIEQSKGFLVKARQYLAEDDLHQACEKGWGAAAHMAKAVAEAQGWRYERHDEFFDVTRRAASRVNDPRIVRVWRKSANELHSFFYLRKMLLDAETIGEDIEDVGSMMQAMEKLTTIAP